MLMSSLAVRRLWPWAKSPAAKSRRRPVHPPLSPSLALAVLDHGLPPPTHPRAPTAWCGAHWPSHQSPRTPARALAIIPFFKPPLRALHHESGNIGRVCLHFDLLKLYVLPEMLPDPRDDGISLVSGLPQPANVFNTPPSWEARSWWASALVSACNWVPQSPLSSNCCSPLTSLPVGHRIGWRDITYVPAARAPLPPIIHRWAASPCCAGPAA
jgi:hypothetical protein